MQDVACVTVYTSLLPPLFYSLKAHDISCSQTRNFLRKHFPLSAMKFCRDWPLLGNNLEEKEKKGNCKTFGVTHKRTKKKNGNGKAFCVTRKRKKLQDRLWEIFLRYTQKQKRLY